MNISDVHFFFQLFGQFIRKTSRKLNLLRVFLRLLKDIKSIDLKKYSLLEESVDEIGRMLGGWIKSAKE